MRVPARLVILPAVAVTVACGPPVRAAVPAPCTPPAGCPGSPPSPTGSPTAA